MTEKGKLIGQAYHILNRTYKEIYRLKDDLGDVLLDYDETIKYFDEYSYGPKSLFLKPYHTFFFRQEIDFEESGNEIGNLRALVMICLFDEFDGMDRVNLKEEPELWVGVLDIEDKLIHCRAPCAYQVLLTTQREFFDKELRIGGEIFYYSYNEGHEYDDGIWTGQFLGYALTEINDREAIKEKILDKLFG